MKNNKKVLKAIDFDFRTGVFATSGTGKTVTSAYILGRATHPVVFFDYKDDLTSMPIKNATDKRIQKIISKPFNLVNESALNSKKNIQKLFRMQIENKKQGNNLHFAIRGRALDDLELTQTRLARLIDVYLKGLYQIRDQYKTTMPIIIAVDEADEMFPQLGSSECKDEMKRLLSKGRSVGAIGWVITQRTAELHNTAIGNTNQALVMWQRKNDADATADKYENVDKLAFDMDKDRHRFYVSQYDKWSKPLSLKF